MNVVIEDKQNKKYHPFITCTENQALFIISNINKINSKFDTQLTVYENVDTKHFDDKDFKIDQGLFDSYIFRYNANLKDDEELLSLWTRD